MNRMDLNRLNLNCLNQSVLNMNRMDLNRLNPSNCPTVKLARCLPLVRFLGRRQSPGLRRFQ